MNLQENTNQNTDEREMITKHLPFYLRWGNAFIFIIITFFFLFMFFFKFPKTVNANYEIVYKGDLLVADNQLIAIVHVPIVDSSFIKKGQTVYLDVDSSIAKKIKTHIIKITRKKNNLKWLQVQVLLPKAQSDESNIYHNNSNGIARIVVNRMTIFNQLENN